MKKPRRLLYTRNAVLKLKNLGFTISEILHYHHTDANEKVQTYYFLQKGRLNAVVNHTTKQLHFYIDRCSEDIHFPTWEAMQQFEKLVNWKPAKEKVTN